MPLKFRLRHYWHVNFRYPYNLLQLLTPWVTFTISLGSNYPTKWGYWWGYFIGCGLDVSEGSLPKHWRERVWVFIPHLRFKEIRNAMQR